jgi:hypothetical protein
MKLVFVPESVDELAKRKSRFIDPTSELHKYLEKITDNIEKLGYQIDKSRYKKFLSSTSKYHVEIVKTPNLKEMMANCNELKDYVVITNNFAFIDNAFVLNFLTYHITVAFIKNKKLTDEDRKIILNSSITLKNLI